MSTTTRPRKAFPAKTTSLTAFPGATSTGRASAALSARSESGSIIGRSCASAPRQGPARNDRFQIAGGPSPQPSPRERGEGEGPARGGGGGQSAMAGHERTDTVTVAGADGSVRLDRWFKRHYPALGHAYLEKLLRTGRIRVDGKRARSGDRLAPGQVVRVPA